MTAKFTLLDRILQVIDYLLRAILTLGMLAILLAALAGAYVVVTPNGPNGGVSFDDGAIIFFGLVAILGVVVWATLAPSILREPTFLYGPRRREKAKARLQRLRELRMRHPRKMFDAKCGPVWFGIKLVLDWVIRVAFALSVTALPLGFAYLLHLADASAHAGGASSDPQFSLEVWIVSGICTLFFGFLFMLLGWRRRYVPGLPELEVLAFRDELAELEAKEDEADRRLDNALVMHAEYVSREHWRRNFTGRPWR